MISGLQKRLCFNYKSDNYLPKYNRRVHKQLWIVVLRFKLEKES